MLICLKGKSRLYIQQSALFCAFLACGAMEEGGEVELPGYLLTYTVLPNAVVLHSVSWGFPAALESKYISIPVKQVTSSLCDLETILHLNEKTGGGAGRKLLLILESVFFLG